MDTPENTNNPSTLPNNIQDPQVTYVTPQPAPAQPENKAVPSMPAQPVPPSAAVDAPKLPRKHHHVIAFVLLSFIVGTLGGVFGAVGLAQRPGVQKFFGQSGSSSSLSNSLSKSVSVEEESGTIDVVKSASPAVVSIVISKQVNNYQNLSPFYFGFFGIPDQFPGQGGNGGGGSNGNSSGGSQNDQSQLQKVGAGSGFFVSADGLILTNKHVASETDAQYKVVTSDGKEYDAKVVALDPVNDLAVMKIDINNAPFLQFADSSNLQLGQHVIAIGNSLGEYQNTVTTGVVSGLARSIVAGDRGSSEQLDNVIQTDAAINPGNSGGPLLNSAGQVIGINTAVDQQGQLVGFAIPANDAKVALDSYQKNGRITRAFIGIRYMTITADVAKSQNLPKENGALIVRGNTATDLAVIPGSPADKAGLRENDIITEVNGTALTDKKSLSSLLRGYKPGDTVSFKVYSAGQEKTVNVTLGEAK